MKLTKIKIEGYIFEKEEGSWICKTHNLMTGDIRLVSEIMPKLKEIEKVLQ